jgi:hypothetical protein
MLIRKGIIGMDQGQPILWIPCGICEKGDDVGKVLAPISNELAHIYLSATIMKPRFITAD